MARNFTIANPNLPISYGQSRAISSLAGNPAYYVDRETKELTDFALAVKSLTMGEAHAILESQTLPANLVKLAGTAATKVAPKGGVKAKGKAAAEHVKAKPAATKQKAAQPAAKHIDADDRIFSIQSSIEGIRETQERQAASLKGIDGKLERVSAKLSAIEKNHEATKVVMQGFAAILESVQANTTKPARKPKAA